MKNLVFDLEIVLDEENHRLVLRAKAEDSISIEQAMKILAYGLVSMAAENDISHDRVAEILTEVTNKTTKAKGAEA